MWLLTVTADSLAHALLALGAPVAKAPMLPLAMAETEPFTQPLTDTLMTSSAVLMKAPREMLTRNCTPMEVM
jgi:hypothetical protein